MRPNATVLVSTYDEPRYLDLSLLALRVQTAVDFEVIVADDGSGPETARVVEHWRDASPYPLKHVWQEHNGFGKTSILNKAVRVASSEYLIFQDGDCIAHPRFVAEHLASARPGRFLVGRCPRLSKKATKRVTRDRVAQGTAQRMTIGKVLDGLFGQSKRMELGICVKNGLVHYVLGRRRRNTELFGGNFSCYTADFIGANGFDEAFIGFGGEDIDLGMRFKAAGLQAFSLANRAVNFHLAHERPLEWKVDPALKKRKMEEHKGTKPHDSKAGYGRGAERRGGGCPEPTPLVRTQVR
jgi:glycosyltransferase involved in cell wall biosynthesis